MFVEIESDVQKKSKLCPQHIEYERRVAELSGLVHEQSDTLCELKKKLEENIKKNDIKISALEKKNIELEVVIENL